MFSWLTRKNKTNKANEEKAVLNRIAKEARQRKANEAYRYAQYMYETMPELLKNENLRYAKKKGLLEQYGIVPRGPYATLPLAKYKVFEENIKQMRNANKKAEAEERRKEQELFNAETRRLEEEARRMSSASDPRPPSPQGGRQTRRGGRRRRGCRFSRRH